MKLSPVMLRKIIQEELARGVPDYAFARVADEVTNQCADELLKVMVTHVNQTSADSSSRNKKYLAANKVASSLRRDREFAKELEEKIKEKFLEFLDSSL